VIEPKVARVETLAFTVPTAQVLHSLSSWKHRQTTTLRAGSCITMDMSHRILDSRRLPARGNRFEVRNAKKS
jgi:hypothetical protein